MADVRTLPSWARWTATGCAVAVVGASAYLFLEPTSRAATTGLRTATVSPASVTQTITLPGSVQRVDQVSAGFRTSGTVTSVKVAVGDRVRAGQTVATIDDASLERAVRVAEANLVEAQAELEAARSGTSVATASPSSSGGSRSAAGTASASSSSGSTGSVHRPPSGSGSSSTRSGATDPAPLQQATAAGERLLGRAVQVCAPLTGGLGTPAPTPSTTSAPSAASASPAPTTSATAAPTATAGPSPTATPSPSPTATASPVPTSSPTPTDAGAAGPTDTPHPTPTPSTTATTAPATSDTPSAEQVSSCVSALAAALSSTGRAQSTLSRLTGALDAATAALQQQQSAAGLGSSSGTGAGSTGGSGSTRAGGSTGSGAVGGQSTGSTATLEVRVLEATQELAIAQQDLAGARLTAPITGAVGQLDLVAGQYEGAGSGLVVVGDGAATVTVDVPLVQLGQVRVNQGVVVTPAGTTAALDGLVASIGVLPTSNTSSTPTYPVVVTVSEAPVTLATRSTATATITLATATDVLTVPVSALQGLSSGQGEVRVLQGGQTSAVRVSVGAVGEGRAQITTGLTQGQQVLLADASEPLPTASTGLRGFGGLSGRFTGGGPPSGGGGGPGGARGG